MIMGSTQSIPHDRYDGHWASTHRVMCITSHDEASLTPERMHQWPMSLGANFARVVLLTHDHDYGHRTRNHDLERSVELVNSRHSFLGMFTAGVYAPWSQLKPGSVRCLLMYTRKSILQGNKVSKVFQHRETFTHHISESLGNQVSLLQISLS